MIVLDTSAVLFWTQKRTMLSEPALRAIGAAKDIVIPSIVFWEVGWKQKMGKMAYASICGRTACNGSAD